MPEALETWPVNMLGRVLPRHLEIIYEINRRFLEEVAVRYPGNQRKLQEMSLIDEGPVRRVRMANLAIVGSHSVNGVAALHSELLKSYLFRNFHEMYPGKINSKTNGITPRRWLLKCNQDLAQLIGEKIGYDWAVDLDKLRDLEPYSDDPAFHQRWQAVKLVNKKRLAEIIANDCGVTVDPNSLFDIHVKRIHEYKRQLLNVLHLVHFYQRLLTRPDEPVTPRTVIFAGKAAPSYHKAKLIIKLINSVGEVVNNDPGSATGSRWSSFPITASRWRSGSSRPPISPSRSPPPAPRPRAPAT
jgi:glycogen phosphorylase